ncbi:MAG TPA: ABC transporter ATP-binding protein [Streptosporangiaceae bacterium]|nr:ABC transporter ATP-binding protein [Streptosporangiaceae bacterium]
MIEIEGLTRKFGEVTAVDGLTLTIGEGEVFGLIGPNGAGKTTTVRMLACLISRTAGEARIGGHSIGDPAAARKIRSLIGLMPEEAGLYPDLSAARTLDFYGRLYQVPGTLRAERTERLLTLLRLWDRRDAPVKTFSKGMRQRLALARALIHDPPVLFLDEPTANLDPEGAKTVRDFLIELRNDKRTILLNTHHLEEASRVCDRVGVLANRLIAVGSPDELRRSGRGSTTVLRLAEVTGPVKQAAREAGSGDIEVAGNVLTVSVADPERDNPGLVRAIVDAGGQVQFVTESAPSLEEIYLKLIGDKR